MTSSCSYHVLLFILIHILDYTSLTYDQTNACQMCTILKIQVKSHIEFLYPSWPGKKIFQVKSLILEESRRSPLWNMTCRVDLDSSKIKDLTWKKFFPGQLGYRNSNVGLDLDFQNPFRFLEFQKTTQQLQTNKLRKVDLEKIFSRSSFCFLKSMLSVCNRWLANQLQINNFKP